MDQTTAAGPEHPDATLEWLDPATLLADKNIRAKLRLTPEFIDNIRQYGVQQPIVGYRTADGRVRVKLGHRRTAAAIEAGRPVVPVMVYASENDATQAETARILSQLGENRHRADLTTDEEAAAVQELFDLDPDLTVAQAAKKTGMSKPQVTAARAVAASRLASAAGARYDFLDLLQTAAIAEFQDDTEAVKQLTVAARNGQGQFDHELQRLRDTRAERAALADARAALEAQGVTVSDQWPSYDQRLSYLADADGNQLTEESHRTCPGHSARLAVRWVTVEPEPAPLDAQAGEGDGWPDEAGGPADAGYEDAEEYAADDEPAPGRVPRVTSELYCADPKAHGHRHYTADGSARLAGGKMSDAERAERRTVVANNKAWGSAETVRRRWLADFLARKTLPSPSPVRFTTTAWSQGDHELRRAMEHGHTMACALLGLAAKESLGWGEGPRLLAKALATASEARVQIINLALVVGAYEAATDKGTWRHHGDGIRRYFAQLAEWGYELSEVEQLVLAEAKRP